MILGIDMKKTTNIEYIIMILALFFAVFSDLLRIPSTKISFFRIMIPIIIIIVIKNNKLLHKYYFFLMLFFLVSFVQVLSYRYLWGNQVNHSWSHYLNYLFLYFEIWLIFAMIKIIYCKYFTIFRYFVDETFIVFTIVIAILYYFAVIRVPSYIENQNNYSCIFNIIIPLLIAKGKNNKICYLFVPILLLEMLWGDSKISLIVALIEIIVMAIVFVAKQFKNYSAIIIILVLGMIAFLVWILSLDIYINGYNIKIMINGMLTHIKDLTLYPDLGKSLNVRTNTIIILIRELLRTSFLGIGIGNSVLLCGLFLPNTLNSITSNVGISPHNPLLEFISDNGVWAIILVIVLFVFFAKKLIFDSKNASKGDIACRVVVITFPLWCMSASGLYTTFFVWIFIAYVLINEKNSIIQEKLERGYK